MIIFNFFYCYLALYIESRNKNSTVHVRSLKYVDNFVVCRGVILTHDMWLRQETSQTIQSEQNTKGQRRKCYKWNVHVQRLLLNRCFTYASTCFSLSKKKIQHITSIRIILSI